MNRKLPNESNFVTEKIVDRGRLAEDGGRFLVDDFVERQKIDKGMKLPRW
jgi:polyhydroxyalkanoate synthesis regulator phasin